MKALSVLALVPARGGSKRLPGKNARSLGGKPLLEWTFAAARAAPSLGRILLSSDHPDLIAIGEASEAVEVLHRPAELASDTATSVDVAIQALDAERAVGRIWDVLVLLQPTSPFRAAGRIEQGLDLLAAAGAPAVVGVRPLAVHSEHSLYQAQDGSLAPVLSESRVEHAHSQDLGAALGLTGSYYAIRSDTLRETRGFLPPGTRPLICDRPGEDIDIDTHEDFARAEEFVRSDQQSPSHA